MRKIIVFFLVCLLYSVSTFATTSINYQGQLQQSAEPFTGTANLQFMLYDQESGGTQVGLTVIRDDWPIKDGLFQAELDFGADVFGSDARFLEVRVNGTPMTPRQRIQPAPVAHFALDGNPGPEGPEGPEGPAGIGSLITMTPTSPDANCVGGGQRIDSGPDLNEDGTLQAGEVTQTGYVCNTAVCTTSTEGVISGEPWTVCSADETSLWISSTGSGGTYQADQICALLGYPTLSQWGGNCEDTCGFCQSESTSCAAPGTMTFDGAGAGDFPQLAISVTWLCTK